jgi:hypothetical protein
MKDGVSTAKLGTLPKNCSLEDVEIIEKGVHSVWSVDENGEAQEHIEDYSMEAYYAYYDCTGCGQDWVINAVQDKEQAFKLVKEHLNN